MTPKDLRRRQRTEARHELLKWLWRARELDRLVDKQELCADITCSGCIEKIVKGAIGEVLHGKGKEATQ